MPSQKQWTMIGAVAGVLALIVPFGIWYLSTESKAFSVRLVAKTTLVDLTEPALSGVRLTYNNAQIDKVTSGTMEFVNSGRDPIEVGDFERDLVLRFPKPDSVLAVVLGERSPANLHPRTYTDGKELSLEPLLLNSGDRFRLTVHMRGNWETPEVDARIKRIQQASWSDAAQNRMPRVARLLFAAGLWGVFVYAYVGAFAVSLVRSRPVSLHSWEALGIALTLSGTGVACLVASLLISKPDSSGVPPLSWWVSVIAVLSLGLALAFWSRYPWVRSRFIRPSQPE